MDNPVEPIQKYFVSYHHVGSCDMIRCAAPSVTKVMQGRTGTYETPRGHDSEIYHGISLFSEPVQLGLLPDSKLASDRFTQIDGEALPDKRPENDIVGDEDEVEVALLVTGVAIRGRGNAVGDKEKRAEGIRGILCDVWRQKLPVTPQHNYEKEELQGRR